MSNSLNSTSTPERHSLGGRSVWLPITYQHHGKAPETGIAMEAVLEAMITLPHLYHVRYEISAGGGLPTTAGFHLSGIDDASTWAAADTFTHVLNALNGWTGIGDPVPSPDAAPASQRYSLRPIEGIPREIYSHRSGAWTVAAELPTRTTMRVDFLGSDHDQEVAARCQIVIEGDGDDASLVASLVSSEAVGNVRLEPELLSDPLAPEMTIDLTMAAHLVATSSRLREVWPSAQLTSIDEIYDKIEAAMPPHVAVFGGSGLGKTTFLEHLIDRSARDGNSVVVFCPHGDLAGRAAAVLERRGIDADVYDFGHEAPPLLNLCEVPEGFTGREWSGELVHLVRSMWPNAPEDWFGPVFRRSLRSAARVLIEDPRGPHHFGQIVDVIRDPKPWLLAATRIGDPDVVASMNETAKAVSKDREQGFGPCIFGKLEPVLGNEVMRQIIDQPHTTIRSSAAASGTSMVFSVPSAQLGDEGSTLLTSAVLSQIWRSLRTKRDEDRRIDIFIDEAHRMPSKLIAEILAEARKYGVRLRLATQSPWQLDESLRDAVLSNSGATATFRSSPKTAAILDSVFPTVTMSTMTQLDKYQIAATFGTEDLVAITDAAIVNREESDASLERRHLAHRDGVDLRPKEEEPQVRSSNSPTPHYRPEPF